MVAGINGDGRRLGLGWWTEKIIHRWCVMELYTWNSYNYFLERGEGRGKERERNIDVREKHQLIMLHVPGSGIKLVTFQSAGWHPANWATWARAETHIILLTNINPISWIKYILHAESESNRYTRKTSLPKITFLSKWLDSAILNLPAISTYKNSLLVFIWRI